MEVASGSFNSPESSRRMSNSEMTTSILSNRKLLNLSHGSSVTALVASPTCSLSTYSSPSMEAWKKTVMSFPCIVLKKKSSNTVNSNGALTGSLAMEELDGDMRLQNLFHRTWFTEYRKFRKGMPASHPILHEENTSRVDSKAQPSLCGDIGVEQGHVRRRHQHYRQEGQQIKCKKWELYFSDFLRNINSGNLYGSSQSMMNSRLERSIQNGNLFANFDWKRKKSLSSFEIMKDILKKDYKQQMFNSQASSLSSASSSLSPSETSSHDYNGKEVLSTKNAFSSVNVSSSIATPVTASSLLLSSTNEQPNIPSVDALLRTTFTDFHNDDKLGGYNDNTSAFLGESSSMQCFHPLSISNMQFPPSSDDLHSHSNKETDFSSRQQNTKRCFMKLPVTQFIDEAGEALATLTQHSWMLPYIIKNTKPELISRILVAAMEDLGLKDEKIFAASISYCSIFSSDMPLSPRNSPKRSRRINKQRSPTSTRPKELLLSPPRHDQVPPGLATSPGSVHSADSRDGNTSSDSSNGEDSNPEDSSMKNVSIYTEQDVGTYKPWTCLGKVLVTRSIHQEPFQQRIIYAADNYLFESLVSTESPDILGYIPMCNSNVSIVDGGNCQNGKAVKVEFNIFTDGQTSKGEIFIRTLKEADLSCIHRDLNFLSELSIDHVYHVERDKDKILGSGRCNQVLLAKRKTDHNSFLEQLIELHTAVEASSQRPGSVQPPKRTESSDFLAYSDSSYTTPLSSTPTSSLSIHVPSSGSLMYSSEKLWTLSSQNGVPGNDTNYYANASHMSCTSLAELKTKREKMDTSQSPASLARKSVISDSSRRNTRYCALKIVSKSQFWKRVEGGRERSDSIIREVLAQAASWLKGAENPSNAHRLQKIPIVQIYNVMETVNDFILELELMEGKDLFDELSEHGHFTEEAAQDIAFQLVEAASLCYQSGVSHRDFKLQNITFPLGARGVQNSRNMEIKLADFGMSGFRGNDGLMYGRCGTPGYVAPDILKAGLREGYDANVDIFSIGVVIYTLLCGYEPFYGENDDELIKANKAVLYEFHSPEWDNISDDAKDFVQNCLIPQGRFTPMEAADHPWLKESRSRRASL